MVVAITTGLIGDSYPQAVQVVATGLTVGDSFTLMGQAGAWSWSVRAGTGVADASQVVRSDMVSPINTPVTYTVIVNGVAAATSAPTTVPFVGASCVLQSLNSATAVGVLTLEDGLPRTEELRSSQFSIPGRLTPVSMYDVGASTQGSYSVQTVEPATSALRALIRSGAPVMMRTNGSFRDVPAVEFLQITGASSVATWVTVAGTTGRDWSLPYVVLDDPEPNTLVPTSTWDDFDRAYTGLTWANFDTEWTGSTWDQFDLEDWSTR